MTIGTRLEVLRRQSIHLVRMTRVRLHSGRNFHGIPHKLET